MQPSLDMMDNPSSRQKPRSLMGSFPPTTTTTTTTTTIPTVLLPSGDTMQAQTQAYGQQDILWEFKRKLEFDWKRTNFEDKHFYQRDDIYNWMNLKVGDNSNVVLLFVRVHKRINKGGKFPEITSKTLMKPKSLIVFAILLSLDYGHLIQIFHKHNVTDDRLDLTIEQLQDVHRAIKEDLESEHEDPEKVISAFEKRKWAFIPVPFRLLMHDHLKGINWVLPFAKRRKIAQGGTATIYQVLVHKDLLTEDFREAIKAGKQTHESLKDHYEFAIKEYTKANANDYKRECHAFRAIRGQEGMVQFLGQFVYDKKDEDGRRETIYNILLEFGEFDLDEFFGDQLQYPPVLQLEIVMFWESFFKVADAISRVHNLEFETEDGHKKVYRGWHADIKPENILRVYGEFKLADFGFASFSDFNWVPGQIPTKFIHGGTAAYGAPETDISRHRRGTLTPVSQTIDTWSFGCVLSITATWVVLGVQGVYQYQQVRKVAISKLQEQKQKPSSQDAFHDGKDVLPEIKQWHHYLRTSMRKCDPMTDKILDLIEERMLVADPGIRIQCKDLCDKLNSFLDDAHMACHRPEMSITQGIMATLLEFDRKAPSSALEAREIKAEEVKRAGIDDDANHEELRRMLAPNETLRAKSKRFSRPDRQVVVQGKFAHRTLALESALRRSSDISMLGNTDKGKGIEQSTSVVGPHGPMAPSPSQSSVYDSPRPPGSVADSSFRLSVELDQLADSSSTLKPGWQDHQEAQWAGGDITREYRFFPPAQNRGSKSRTDTSPRTTTPPPPVLTAEPGEMTPRMHKVTETKPEILRKESEYHTRPSPDLADHGALHIQQPYGSSELAAIPRITETTPEPAVIGSPSKPDPTVAAPKRCPGYSPYRHLEHLNEAICIERRMLDSKKDGGVFGRFKKPKKDETLKDLISNRDFIFVVDRAPTMGGPIWEWATFLVETLAMKLARLDDDGLDLVFTSGGDDLSSKGVKDATRFRLAMEKAEPNPRSPKTDMSRCIGEISEPYLTSFLNKKLTLIIVTDGMWCLAGSAAEQNPVDLKIVNFVKQLTDRAGKSRVEDRWFSIQFVSFATDPKAHQYLDYLDSGLKKQHDIPDVIDTKPWDHPEVHNLILGSLDPYADHTPDGGVGQDPAPDGSSGVYGQAGPSSAVSSQSSQSLQPNSHGLRRSASSQSKRKSGISLGSVLKRL